MMFPKRGKIFLLSGLCISTALVTFLTATSAQAGFQWNPPQSPIAPQSETIVTPNNSIMPDAVTSGPLTPMPTDSASLPNIDQPPAAPAGMKKDDADRTGMLETATMQLPGVPAPLAPMASPSATGMVDGFGKDIPLAIALRQVVPPQYAFSFAPGVDQGKPVSWTGGGPWPDVLNTMLASRKLHAEMNGNVLSIVDGQGPAVSPAQISSMPVNAMPVAMASSSPQPVIDMMKQNHWEAKPGQSLQQTLKDWSAQANVALSWQDAGDMPIGSAFSYDGTFDQAVDALLSLYSGGPKEPRGKLYPNLPQGPSVLVVGMNN